MFLCSFRVARLPSSVLFFCVPCDVDGYGEYVESSTSNIVEIMVAGANARSFHCYASHNWGPENLGRCIALGGISPGPAAGSW